MRTIYDTILWLQSSEDEKPFPIVQFTANTDMATDGWVSLTSTEHPEALRFTKKPVTIVASQWFKSGDHPAVRDITDSDDLFFTGMGGATLVEREKFGVIGTLESPNHLVTPGDWIITGVAGEMYPCKDEIFRLTYEPADDYAS